MKKRETSSGWTNPFPVPGAQPQPQPQSQPQPTSTNGRRRHPVLSHALVALVALGLGAAIGSAGNGTDANPPQAGAAATSQAAVPASTAAAQPASASSAAVPAPATSAAAAPTTHAAAPARTTARAAASAKRAPSVPTTVSGDGEYLVGTDMRAGTYRTAGPSSDSLGDCYWERDKNASGDFDAIIANDDLSGSGIVTVNRGEYFKTSGCQNWVRVS